MIDYYEYSIPELVKLLGARFKDYLARTNDANGVVSNLKAAIAADKSLAKEAAIDLEFAKYATNSDFSALVK